jgi:hypothetical protein
MLLNPLVRFLAPWCAILTLLTACGSLTHSANDSLGVNLQLPDGEESTSFWIGVSQKTLTVTPEGAGPTTIPWVEGQNGGVELHQGDRISFAGSDQAGRVVVAGETTVGEEKNVTIPLRRVL